MNSSFRPTPYRPMHLGSVWNAYLNWTMAARSGGEFVLVMDDIGADAQRLWRSGFPLRAEDAEAVGLKGAPNMLDWYVEDLTWFGMKPDRVEWSSSNSERHEWANEKLGFRKPKQIEETGWIGLAPSNQISVDETFSNERKATDGEGRIEYEANLMPWYMACCIVDDNDFGIGAWCAGVDQLCNAAWCLWAYDALRLKVPMFWFHSLFKDAGGDEKLGKSKLSTPVRRLKEAGYDPQHILATLRECNERSRFSGHQCNIIPEGILGLDEVRTMRNTNHQIERLADEGEPSLSEDEACQPYIKARCAYELSKLRRNGG